MSETLGLKLYFRAERKKLKAELIQGSDYFQVLSHFKFSFAGIHVKTHQFDHFKQADSECQLWVLQEELLTIELQGVPRSFPASQVYASLQLAAYQSDNQRLEFVVDFRSDHDPEFDLPIVDG